MGKCLTLKKSNCKNCYKCIRHCPVKSIRFSGNQAHIIEDECILCGQCFVVCPQNAKEIRNDTGAVRELIAAGKPVYASVAPSFVANYPGATIAGMDKALRALGFAGASETAIGATSVKTLYDEMCERGTDDVIISSCCHTVNLLIRKYFPGAGAFPDAGTLQIDQGRASGRCSRVHRSLHFQEGRGGTIPRYRRLRTDL